MLLPPANEPEVWNSVCGVSQISNCSMGDLRSTLCSVAIVFALPCQVFEYGMHRRLSSATRCCEFALVSARDRKDVLQAGASSRRSRSVIDVGSRHIPCHDTSWPHRLPTLDHPTAVSSISAGASPRDLLRLRLHQRDADTSGKAPRRFWQKENRQTYSAEKPSVWSSAKQPTCLGIHSRMHHTNRLCER